MQCKLPLELRLENPVGNLNVDLFHKITVLNRCVIHFIACKLLNTLIKLPFFQTIFISAIMNVDFIPSFIQE